ncbi:hypothetical protein WMF27_27985 [Sorangium sp. So ce281]|uniref:hypothetical protein n=1 Tax=unclassified Sorangium TaxID=2621164 RepID=UPI003F5E1BCA
MPLLRTSETPSVIFKVLANGEVLNEKDESHVRQLVHIKLTLEFEYVVARILSIYWSINAFSKMSSIADDSSGGSSTQELKHRSKAELLIPAQCFGRGSSHGIAIELHRLLIVQHLMIAKAVLNAMKQLVLTNPIYAF